MEELDYINWWEANQECGLEELKSTFLSLFSNTNFLPSIYHPILYKFLNNSQIKHWDKDVFHFTRSKIQEIESNIGKKRMRSILLSNFHLLSNAYESLKDLEERIVLMNRFKGSEELKAKIFSINIYNDMLNTPFSSILKLFIEFQGVVENNDKLFQKNLTPQIECLSKPERGYQKITDLANSNIRNAISHGGVKAIGSKMQFSYRKGSEYLQHESTVFDFKDSMLQLYDGVNAVILAWIEYLCENNISYDDVYLNENIDNDTKIFFEKLCLSTLKTSCDNIFQTIIRKNDDENLQINIEFNGDDLDINSRMFFCLYTSERIFNLRRLSIKDSVMISFRSPRMVNSFAVIKGGIINDLSRGIINSEQASKLIWESQSIVMFPINEEERNEFEDSFRYYPDIETDEYFITEIEDISTEEKKRFKAVAYLKRAKRRKHVQKATNEIVDKLKNLKNYGFSTNKVKHGDIETDIIYLVLYKKEVRRGKDRALLPNNSNFIAQIQYDVDKEFPLKNNFVESNLKKRIEKEIQYNWNPSF